MLPPLAASASVGARRPRRALLCVEKRALGSALAERGGGRESASDSFVPLLRRSAEGCHEPTPACVGGSAFACVQDLPRLVAIIARL